MTITRFLLNVVGFFALLEGCLGVSSPVTSKTIMLFLLRNLSSRTIKYITILSGLIFGVIFVGAMVADPFEKDFWDYLLILISALLSILYIIMGLTLPQDLNDSGVVKKWLETPNSLYRFYEAGTLAVGIFFVLISVRY
jgi:hypothetical protein